LEHPDLGNVRTARPTTRAGFASIAYGAVTDTYTYNWQGLRTWAYLAGVNRRYVYDGERVLEELNDSGGVLARYTTENDSYYGTLLHLKRYTGESRFPLYDSIGSARGLANASGSVTDTYDMNTFGLELSGTGSTPNPYQYGAAWGYITDPSGLQQLGARFYWPELGRFVQQDPIRDAMNWYAYAGDNPVVYIDPVGLSPKATDNRCGLPDAFWDWYHRQIKQKGAPDIDCKEAREWHKEWERQGMPAGDSKGKYRNPSESRYHSPSPYYEWAGKALVVGGAAYGAWVVVNDLTGIGILDDWTLGLSVLAIRAGTAMAPAVAMAPAY